MSSPTCRRLDCELCSKIVGGSFTIALLIAARPGLSLKSAFSTVLYCFAVLIVLFGIVLKFTGGFKLEYW